MAKEELAANRTHQTGLEAQIQELQKGRGLLEQELAKRDQKLQQQEQTLRELQKQQVRQMDLHKQTRKLPWLDLIKFIYCKLHFITQGQVKEEVEKERSKVEELNKAKSVLEKSNTRVTSELKALTEKSEKVSHFSFEATTNNVVLLI